jgi:5-methylcytosine-specific restriction enzyme A
MIGRSVPEWIGKTPDTPVPPRVRLRVFERYGGVCYLSGRKIGPADKWDLEDIVALCNGGENRESNKAPALKDKHKEKTVLDVAEKAKVYATRSKHLGLKRSSMPGGRNSAWKKKMNGQVVAR